MHEAEASHYIYKVLPDFILRERCDRRISETLPLHYLFASLRASTQGQDDIGELNALFYLTLSGRIVDLRGDKTFLIRLERLC